MHKKLLQYLISMKIVLIKFKGEKGRMKAEFQARRHLYTCNRQKKFQGGEMPLYKDWLPMESVADQQKVFENPLSSKGLLYNIDKEHKQLSS